MKINHERYEGILLVSDPNYENLTAELYYNDELFAIVWYENDAFFIDIPNGVKTIKDTKTQIAVPFDLFISLLEKAKVRLKE